MLYPDTGWATLKPWLKVHVDTVFIDDQTVVRGETASFPYAVMTRVKVYDDQNHYVPMLASRDQWLGLDDQTEEGEPVRSVWLNTTEYHVENPAIPPNPNVKQNPGYFAVTEVRMYDYDLSVMLVMDYSASINFIDQVKDACVNLVRESAGHEPLGVIKFSGQIKLCQKLTYNTALQEAAVLDDSGIIRNQTSLYAAIDTAITMLSGRTGRRVVIVYTDGKNDDIIFSHTKQEVIDHALQYKTELFVVGIGGDIDEPILKELAGKTNGKYYYGEKTKNLDPIFLQIYGELRGYYIMRHMSPDPFQNGTWRWVDVQVVKDSYLTGQGRQKYKVPYFPADIVVTKSVQSDSVVYIPGGQKNYAMASDTVVQTIRIENRGRGAYPAMDIVDVLDDSLTALSLGMVMDDDMTLDSFGPHALTWHLPRLDAMANTVIQYKALLDPVMPIDAIPLTNTVQLQGDSAFTAGSADAVVWGYGEPDFTVSCIAPGFYASPTQTVELQAVIQNLGNAHADRPFRIAFEYQGQVVAYDTLETLNLNTTATVTGKVAFPDWGDYEIVVRADADDAIRELDETNNTHQCTLHVRLISMEAQISDVNYRDTMRGVTGKFPMRLLTSVNIIDQNYFPVPGLADETDWSELTDTTPANALAGDIWTALSETALNNPLHPPEPDVRDGMRVSEFKNSSIRWVLFVTMGNVPGDWFESIRLPLMALGDRMTSADRSAIMAGDASGKTVQTYTGSGAAFKQGIDKLKAGNGLSLWDGLIEAIDLASARSDRNGVIALIGGEDQGSDSSMTAVISHARELGVPLYIVSPQARVNGPLMNQLARATGGISWQYTDEASLRFALQGAERLLRNYYVLQHESSDTLKNLTWRKLDMAVSAYGFQAADDGVYRAPKGIHDVAVSRRLWSAEYEAADGDTVWNVQPGDSAWCTVVIRNEGDFPLYQIAVEDSLPVNLVPQPTGFGTYRINPARLDWTIDTLRVGQSRTFHYHCFIDTLPQLEQQDLIASIHMTNADDEAPWNDTDRDSLWYIPLMAADLSIEKRATGDSLHAVNGDTSWFVHPRGTVIYQLTIRNHGEMPARSIEITDVLPHYLDWTYTMQPLSDVRGDTLVWQVARLNGHGASRTLTYTCEVDSMMPPWDVPLVNRASVYSNDDAEIRNNSVSDTVTAVGLSPPWPLIEVYPALIYPEDPVQVQVLSPFSIQSWDLQVIYEDGSSDRTYADAFIRSHLLEPNNPVDVEPRFTDTGRKTAMREETLRLVFETVDVWGVSRNDTAEVVIALPDLIIDKTVETDSVEVTGNDTLRYADPGETVLYTVSLVNSGLLPCHSIQIRDILPPDVRFVRFEENVQYTLHGDTLMWSLPLLNSGSEPVEYTYHCQVSTVMPPWVQEALNAVSVSCDRDYNTANNTDGALLYLAGDIPPDPRVLVSPARIEPGDSVQVRVASPIHIDAGDWRLIVVFEDGTVIDDYAAAFSSGHALNSGDTLSVTPLFDDTRMRTDEKEERMRVVLETVDGWQAVYTDTAAVTLRSGDAVQLDRNVFRISREQPMLIRFRLSSNRHAKIAIHDISGAHIKTLVDGPCLAGWNQTTWDGLGKQGKVLGSGIYMALYSSGDVQKWLKFIVVR
ncbi:VWA domain-containing protein [bacterium]|nr:VWA domain-containing protein [bacterium]